VAGRTQSPGDDPARSPADGREPLMELPVVAFFLAIAAGTMDGFTFFSAGTFSTVQSGNVIQLGFWLAESDWQKLLDVGLSVVAFGAGVTSMVLFRNFFRDPGAAISPRILLLEGGAFLAVGMPFIGGNMDVLVVAYIVAFLAGFQGTAFHKTAGMTYGNVGATLNVQRAFDYLARAIFRFRQDNLDRSGIYFLILLGFAAGGLIGGLGASHLNQRTLWIPAIVLGALAVIASRESSEREPVDPRP
jgi:uncharacterized membrane protein YoaK (UPF0700 family)